MRNKSIKNRHLRNAAFGLALLLALGLAGCAFGPDSNGDCDECRLLAQEFFTTLSTGNTQAAFRILGEAHSRDKLKLSKTITGTNKILTENGPITGFEPLETIEWSHRFVEFKYLLYQERDLTRWTLYFYKTAEGDWILVNIRGTTNHINF